ncbi:MAG TPA: PQQ-dependent sugar dehydrogenase [Elusimicrobiota bacterium]|jgi:glucose/arabinose dehydrogenase|nr:PQQ-dependent sugar dehydrogenase [Elusimicrobiota bacterium]
MNKNIFSRLLLPAAACAALAASPFNDYRGEYPGRRHRIRASDLPAPDPAESVNNGPSLVERPEGAWPRAPKGWKVELYAQGLTNPRQIRTAPNGDLFVAESAAGRIRILRGADAAGKAKTVAVFASGLRKPFGLAFYPPGPKPKYVYVGDTDAVLRFPYENGDLKARGAPEKIAGLPGGGFVDGGHWTRDVAFSRDGRRMFVSVGSVANVDDADTHPEERGRADILVFAPDGSGRRVYAYGLRNPVGLAVDPGTGALWTSVNERDRLGDNLPPDYVARVREGGFYGWPWYYIGGHPDPRLPAKHPELKDKTLVPDVLIQPHDAPLGCAFSPAGDLFVAAHGSWNRAARAGYEIIRVPLKKGRADGSYEDFVAGFVTDDGRVWGRPVGVAFDRGGALLFSDDASGSVWRVSR